MRLRDLLGIIERAYKERIDPRSDYFMFESLGVTDVVIPLHWPDGETAANSLAAEEFRTVNSFTEEEFRKRFNSYHQLQSGLIVSPVAVGILDEPAELYQPLSTMYRKL